MNVAHAMTPLFSRLERFLNESSDAIDISAADIHAEFVVLVKSTQSAISDIGLSKQYQEDSLFALCCLIDEQVLGSAIQEKQVWQESSLQKLFFKKNGGGIEFFERLDSLDPLAPGSNEVREIYLYCLKMGFLGKFFELGDRAHLEKLISANYRLLLSESKIGLSIDPLSDRELFNPTPSIFERMREIAAIWAPVAAVAALYFVLRADIFAIIASTLSS